MSVLPAARSAEAGENVTFFATFVSTSDRPLTCAPQFNIAGGTPPGVTADVSLFALDADGAVTGFANDFFSIDPSGRRDTLVVLSVDGEMQGPLDIDIRCQTDRGEFLFPDKHPGVNDFQVTVTSVPGPDIVMVSDTISHDGVARVGDTGPRAALMTIAAVNIGAEGTNLVVRPFVTGFSMMERLPASICELDGASRCIADRSPDLQIAAWPNGEVRFFGAFFDVPQHTGLPFWPDILRVAVGIGPEEDLGGGVPVVSGNRPFNSDSFLSVTSAAVSAQPLQVDLMGTVNRLRATAPELTDGPYQCSSRASGDPAALSLSFGGVIVINTPRDLPETPGMPNIGYLRAQDFNNQFYMQPVTLAPRLDGGSGFELVLLGNGQEHQQQNDAEIPATVEFSFPGGMRINWDGDPSLDNSFFQDGTSRCVQVPDGPHAANQPPTVVDPLPQTYAADEFTRRIFSDVDEEESPTSFIATIAAVAVMRGASKDAGWLMGQLFAGRTAVREETPAGKRVRIEELDVTDAFLGFFAMLGTPSNSANDFDVSRNVSSEPEAVISGIVFVGPGQAGAAVPDCLVAIFPDDLFPTSEGSLDNDARVELLTRLIGSVDDPGGQVLVEIDPEACLP